MKDAKGHGSNARGGVAMVGGAPVGSRLNSQGVIAPDAAHQVGVSKVGALPLESPTSHNLRMFADNDRDLNRQSTQPIRDNLGKKMDKGTYDPQKAEKLWGYHADRAAQAYAKQEGNGQDWHKMFSPAVRREAAAHWERDERSDIKSGSSRTYKG